MSARQDSRTASVHSPFPSIRDSILRHRWPIVIALGLLGLVAELFEHSTDSGIHISADLLQEVFLVGVVIPAVAGFLLDELVRALQRAAVDRANAVDAERYRLSRDVHDSLAQDVSYLHFKLDQLIRNKAELDCEATHRQLDQLRDVARQAYKRTYDMLALLRVPASTSLPDALLRHAERVARRGQFEIQFVTHGEPCLLPAELRQQLLYVFGEMVSNVEKHARAQHLDVSVTWGIGELTISVCDDGQGFDTETGIAPGHFGLTIMRERAHEMGGRLSVRSRPAAGTEVVLAVRFDPCSAA